MRDACDGFVFSSVQSSGKTLPVAPVVPTTRRWHSLELFRAAACTSHNRA